MRLLIIGGQADLHVQSVRKSLSDDFDVESDLLDFSASKGGGFRISNSNDFKLPFADGDCDSYFAIWRRYKLRLPVGGLGDEFRSKYVSVKQQLAFAHGVSELLGVRVINYPMSGLTSKLSELRVARDVGLRIPLTLIPTTKQEIVDLLTKGRRLICKSLGDPNTPIGDGSGKMNAIMTARVSMSDVAEIDEESLIMCPHFFQEEIEKSLELRVIVTKERCFAFSIDSQIDELTSVDWRYGNTYLEFNDFNLDAEIVRKLRKYLLEMGLLYGSFDLILDPDGKIWFLECNFEGQWNWLDQENGKISHAIAEAIASCS